MNNKFLFFLGIGILILLAASYLITLTLPGETTNTVTSLLGLLIFYNPLVLVFYILVAIFLIIVGLKKIRIV